MENNNHGIYGPCHFLKEAVSAALKCLGLDSKPYCENDSSSSSKEGSHACPDDDSPPSTTVDPSPANDPPTEEMRGRRRPIRPELGTGPDPQTNSNQSF